MTFHKEFRPECNRQVMWLLSRSPCVSAQELLGHAWGLLISSAVLVALSYVMQPYRPWFTLSHWRELMSFTIVAAIE